MHGGEEAEEAGTPLEGDRQAKETAYAKAQRQENDTFRKTRVIWGGQRVVGQGVTKLGHEQGPNVIPALRTHLSLRTLELSGKGLTKGETWSNCVIFL